MRKLMRKKRPTMTAACTLPWVLNRCLGLLTRLRVVQQRCGLHRKSTDTVEANWMRDHQVFALVHGCSGKESISTATCSEREFSHNLLHLYLPTLYIR